MFVSATIRKVADMPGDNHGIKETQVAQTAQDDGQQQAAHGPRWSQRQGDPHPEDLRHGAGDYTRNVGYKTGSITHEYETHSFGYDRAIRLFADVMNEEESGVLDCFVEAGAELQRTQVAPESDAYTFSQVASIEGVTVKGEDLSEASAVDVLAALRAVTNDMDEKQVSTGSRYLFISPTLRGVLDDF